MSKRPRIVRTCDTTHSRGYWLGVEERDDGRSHRYHRVHVMWRPGSRVPDLVAEHPAVAHLTTGERYKADDREGIIEAAERLRADITENVDGEIRGWVWLRPGQPETEGRAVRLPSVLSEVAFERLAKFYGG